MMDEYNLVITNSIPPTIFIQRPAIGKERLDSNGNEKYHTITYKVNPWLRWINSKTNKVQEGYCSCHSFMFKKVCKHVVYTKLKLKNHANKFKARTYDEEDLWFGFDKALNLLEPKKIKLLLSVSNHLRTKNDKWEFREIGEFILVKEVEELLNCEYKSVKKIQTYLRLIELKYKNNN